MPSVTAPNESPAPRDGIAVWISGASSGIGAALAASSPFVDAHLIGISRRAPARGEHLEADLSDPAAWTLVAAHFEDVLESRGADYAVFLHMSGTVGAIGAVADTDRDAYTAAVLLNSASGQVLGKAFLEACRATGARATLVLCSSPAAATPASGASHYGAGKAALQYWAAAVATEADGWAKVFSVVPYAVDTPMVRETIAQPPGTSPIADRLRVAADRGALATADTTAAEIWQLVLDDTTQGAAVPVGAVPAELRSA